MMKMPVDQNRGTWASRVESVAMFTSFSWDGYGYGCPRKYVYGYG